MIDLPGDPNLPPGCTNADIDRAFESPDDFECECEECGCPLPDGHLCRECRKMLAAEHADEVRQDRENLETP